MPASWLPELFLFEDFAGDWDAYLETVYRQFRRDFIESPPKSFLGKRFGLKRHPMERGKEATFWHLVQTGKIEADRTPDIRRCERIGWPRKIIDRAGSNDVCMWKNSRSSGEGYILALPDFSYKVVMADRGEYVLLWSAFAVEFDNQRRRLEKEWENYRRSQNS